MHPTAPPPHPALTQAQLAAEDRVRYEADKAEQRVWASALSIIGVAATYASYDRDVCISYTVRGRHGGLGCMAGCEGREEERADSRFPPSLEKPNPPAHCHAASKRDRGH